MPRLPPVVALVAPLALLAASPGLAGGCDYWVGDDPGCGYATLASALLAAAFTSQADTVCVSKNHSETNVALTLTNWDNPSAGTGSGPLTLSGGWTACGASQSGRTAFDGNGSDPVVEVRAGAGRQSFVTLDHLELYDGSDGVNAEGDVDVNLLSTVVRNNDRGVWAWYGADVEIDYFSEVRHNTGVSTGAGIYCGDSTVTIRGLVYGNSAGSGGGGLAAQTGCDIFLYEGAWIYGNSASRGAGIDVIQGTVVRGGGTGDDGVRIFNNVASDAGGGIYAAGEATDVLLANTLVLENYAGNYGAGVAVGGGARVQLERFNFEHCATPPRCAVLADNELLSGDEGSAVHASYGGEFFMYQGFVEGNRAPGESGYALYAVGENAKILLDGVQFVDNRTLNLAEARDDARITFGFVTAATNRFKSGAVYLDAAGARGADGGIVGLYSSVLANHGAHDSSTGTVDAHCLITATTSGLTAPFGQVVSGVDPKLKTVPGGVLRPALDSPAIDFCDTSEYTPLDADFDVDGRGWNMPSVPNGTGSYDLGADEVRPLFADGFNGGGTGAWSATVGL